MSTEEKKPESVVPPSPADDVRQPRRQHDEKEEKDEKDREKSEKDEKFTRDPLSAIIWAIIFISAGVILLAGSMGWVDWERIGSAWQPILIVAGFLFLAEAAVRLIVPAFRRPILGTLIFAFFLLAVGLGGAFNWSVTWPLFLILIGVAIILGGLFKGRL